MPHEVSALVRRFGIGVITYSELVEAICKYLENNRGVVESTLPLLKGLPDPLLGDLSQDVERMLNQQG